MKNSRMFMLLLASATILPLRALPERPSDHALGLSQAAQAKEAPPKVSSLDSEPPADLAELAPPMSVTFESLKAISEENPRHGFVLDGSVRFYFADEDGPAALSDELRARGSTWGGDSYACRRALVAAFLSFQERAKREGFNAVVGVRTYARLMVNSANRERCLCRVGHRASTMVKGRLAKIGVTATGRENKAANPSTELPPH
jgi:hypothetical protein